MMMLITGGAGYIGSVATEELIKAGYDIVVYDNLTQGRVPSSCSTMASSVSTSLRLRL